MELDAVDQARLVASGEATALELVDAAIARIEAVNPTLNALVSLDADAARERAKAAAGPLGGVPFLIKDLLSYPGQPYTLGSRLFSQQIAAEGSPYTDRLDAAGLLPLGKTTTSEFGLLGSCESLLSGPTRNPWDLSKSPAGSSGGAAAAVASGMVPVAHASDGGGSIRIPASVCGLFGFKPGRGRCVSNGQNAPFELIVEHCVSRSVRDSAALFAATENRTDETPPVDHFDLPAPGDLRIGFYTETLFGAPPDAEVADALDKTAALCEELGHRVVAAPPPPVKGQDLSDAFFTLVGSGLNQLALRMEPVLGRPVGAGDFEPFTLELIDRFRELPPDAAARAIATCERAGEAMRAYLRQYDVVLTPTVPVLPWDSGHLAPDLGGKTLIARTEYIAGYTAIHNMAGTPAMSVPLGWSDAGLPIGSHFASSQNTEALLLGLAGQLEAAAPWADRYRTGPFMHGRGQQGSALKREAGG